MNRESKFVIGMLAVMSTAIGGTAVAQQSSNDRPAPPVPAEPEAAVAPTPLIDAALLSPVEEVLSIPAAAFIADGNQPDSSFFSFGVGEIRGTATYGCIAAPVELPDGAVVNALRAFMLDTSAISIDLKLQRSPNLGPQATTMAQIESFNWPLVHVVEDDTVTNGVVDNAEFSYFVTACLRDPNLGIRSVQIDYQRQVEAGPPVLVPVSPFRVHDSRFGGGRLLQGEHRVVSVADSIDIETGAVVGTNAVPAGATAIMFNLAVTDTTGAGFATVTPGTSTTFSSASINWSSTGTTANNGTFVEVDANRNVKVFVDGSPLAGTHFVIDVTGYLIAS